MRVTTEVVIGYDKRDDAITVFVTGEAVADGIELLAVENADGSAWSADDIEWMSESERKCVEEALWLAHHDAEDIVNRARSLGERAAVYLQMAIESGTERGRVLDHLEKVERALLVPGVVSQQQRGGL